jgi:hypothetical protein
MISCFHCLHTVVAHNALPPKDGVREANVQCPVCKAVYAVSVREERSTTLMPEELNARKNSVSKV